MADFLIRFHTRLLRCCQSAPSLGNAFVLAFVLAGVWGGPYDYRYTMTHHQSALATTDDSKGGESASAVQKGFISLDAGAGNQDSPLSTPVVLQREYASLMSDLNLGDLGISDPMMSALVSKLPDDIAALPSQERKKAFIALMLPTVMVALDEVRQERQGLLAIVAELGGIDRVHSFSEEVPEWQDQLGPDKVKFILELTRKYRTTNVQELVAMVNVLPPSLILAQGAIESGWGASRIAQNCNNLFGMYSSITTSTSEGDPVLRLTEYDTILDSVRAYILNLNRLSAYKEMREIRRKTSDPMRIAEGLIKYSERKTHYVADVKLIIELNRLQHYDSLIQTAG